MALSVSLSFFLCAGLIGQSYDFLEVQLDGVSGVDGLDGPYGVAISPDGKHVYTASSTDDAVAVFSKSGVGTLSYVESHLDDGQGGSIDGLQDAKRLAVSPDGNHLYVPSSSDDAIVVFSRNSTTGALTYVETIRDGVGGVDGLDGAHEVLISPDNQHLYAVGYVDDAVVVFSRNTSTGTLTHIETHLDGISGIDGLNNARGLAISPDGKHLYVASATDDAIAVFSRNSTTGALTYVERQQDGIGGADGLNGAYGICVSSDGNQVYVASYVDDAVAVFSRNSTTGALSYLEMHQDDSQGGSISSINAARHLAITSDGSHVVVVSSTDDALTIFGRNATTGRLVFEEELIDGIGGTDGLNGARMIAISPDDYNFFVVSSSDDAIAVIVENTILSPPLLSFELIQEGNQVTCRWTGLSGETVDRYTIERSADGQQWDQRQYPIQVHQRGDSSCFLATDLYPLSGTSYYRILYTDLSGDQSYSQIEATNVMASDHICLFPNPVKNVLHIDSDIAIVGGSIEITDLSGKPLFRQAIQTEPRQQPIQLNLAFLPPAMYVLHLRTEKATEVQIFLKQ